MLIEELKLRKLILEGTADIISNNIKPDWQITILTIQQTREVITQIQNDYRNTRSNKRHK